MAGNTPNISKDSFSALKLYDAVSLQQGVPIPDSDFNEAQDIKQLSEIINNRSIIGSGILPVSTNKYGYTISSTGVSVNDFNIAAGWAVVDGVVVPTTMAETPVTHQYDSNTNIMGEGVVTAVAGGKITDANNNWQTFHDLVGCRVVMTSGAESGNAFTITVRDSTIQLTLSGGIGTIGVDDTFVIRGPVLTTPSGGDRTDEVFLMVWWEDINENEDGDIVNAGLAVETAHRKQRRWCVRVEEGGSAPTTPAYLGFGVRYLTLASVLRPDTESDFDDATITMVANRIRPYSHFSNVNMMPPAQLAYTSLSAVTKFHLTVPIYVGREDTADYEQFINLYSDYNNTPLMGSDYRRIGIASFHDTTDDHTITNTDVDADGFITDPWVYLDFTDTVDAAYTGDIYPVVNINGIAGDPIVGDISGFPSITQKHFHHADDIQIGDEGTPGTPEFDRFSYTGPKTLQGGLDFLIGALNNLVIDERSPGSTWTVLWRSLNVREDSNVTGETITIYFRSGCCALIVGGYIDTGDNNEVKSGTGSAVQVHAIAIHSGAAVQTVLCSKLTSSAGQAIGTLDEPDGWGNYQAISDIFDGSPRQIFYTPLQLANSLLLKDDSGGEGNVGSIQLANHAESKIAGMNLSVPVVRKLFETWTSDNATATIAYEDGVLWIFNNIEYDTAGGQHFSMMEPDDDGFAVKFKKDGVTIYYVPSSVSVPQADWHASTWYTFAIHRWGGNTGDTNLAYHLEDMDDDDDVGINNIVSPAMILVKNMSTGESAMLFYADGNVDLINQGSSIAFGGNDEFGDANKICIYYNSGLRCENRTNATIDIKIGAFGLAHLTS